MPDLIMESQAELAMKQLESLSPPIMKQVLPLVEQLPPLYMDLAKGREDFSPKPEETRRLVRPGSAPLVPFSTASSSSSSRIQRSFLELVRARRRGIAHRVFSFTAADKILLRGFAESPDQVQG